MASERYCPNCRQMVSARSFNWILLILLFIGGCIYRPVFIAFAICGAYYTFRKPRCPMCRTPLNNKHAPYFQSPDQQSGAPNGTKYYQPPSGYAQAPTYENPSADFCPWCGADTRGAVFCSNCGKRRN